MVILFFRACQDEATAPLKPPRCGTRGGVEGLHVFYADSLISLSMQSLLVTLGSPGVHQLCQTYSCVKALVLLRPVRQVSRLLQTVLVGWKGKWDAFFLFFLYL